MVIWRILLRLSSVAANPQQEPLDEQIRINTATRGRREAGYISAFTLPTGSSNVARVP